MDRWPLCAAASFPALLPSFSLVCVTSRMSSITWKASPRARPKSLIALELRRRGVGAHRAEAHRGGQQRRGLVFVNVAQLRAIDPLAFAFEIGNLAGNQSPAAGGDGDFAKNRAQIVARPRLRLRRDLKGDREQRVTRQNRDAVAKNLVTGRATAPEIVVVHAREIVVDERVGVDALDRAGEGKRAFR